MNSNTDKILDFWLFDNYSTQESGATTQDAINIISDYLRTNTNLNTLVKELYGTPLVEHFLYLIENGNRLFNNGSLEKKMKNEIGYFKDHSDLNKKYNENNIGIPSLRNFIKTVVNKLSYSIDNRYPYTIELNQLNSKYSNKKLYFDMCVNIMKIFIEENLSKKLDFYVQIGTREHAIGFYYKKLSNNNYAVFIINTGGGAEYQNVNPNGIDNGGVMGFEVTLNQLSKFLTYILLFEDDIASTSDFYSILVKDLVSDYSIKEQKYLNKYQNYLFEITTPLQIIGNCTFKAIIYLLEILEFEKKNLTLKPVNSKTKIFESSPEFNLFYNYGKVILLDEKLSNYQNHKYINVDDYIMIQKLNEQFIYLSNDKSILFDRYIGLCVNLKDKNKTQNKINDLFDKINKINKQILSIVYKNIEEYNLEIPIPTGGNSLNQDNLNSYEFNTDFDLNIINKKIDLEKKKNNFYGLYKLVDDIKNYLISNISGRLNKKNISKNNFITILENIKHLTEHTKELRNKYNNIFLVKHNICFITNELNELLKIVYSNISELEIKSTSDKQYENDICDYMSEIYSNIYILNSDFYNNYDIDHTIDRQDNFFENIVMIKDYTQIIFLSIIIILSLIKKITKINTNNEYLNCFEVYIGSFIIRNFDELNLVNNFKNYLIKNKLFEYILLPTLNTDNILEKNLIIDIQDSYDMILNNNNIHLIKDKSRRPSLPLDYSAFVDIKFPSPVIINKSKSENKISDTCTIGVSTNEYLNSGYYNNTGNYNVNCYYNSRDLLFMGGYGINTNLSKDSMIEPYVIKFSNLAKSIKIKDTIEYKDFITTNTERDDSIIIDEFVESFLNKTSSINNVLIGMQIKLYAKGIFFKTENKKKVKKTSLEKVLEDFDDNIIIYKYIHWKYNYFISSYGSFSKILFNICNYINGNADTYDFMSINLGTPGSDSDNINNFSTYLSKERLLFDIENNQIESLHLYIEMVNDKFKKNIVHSKEYGEYEKIVLNLIMIISMYDYNINNYQQIIEYYLNKLYQINLYLTNKPIDLLIYSLLVKCNLKIFEKYTPDYIYQCEIFYDNLLKLIRIININNLICQNNNFYNDKSTIGINDIALVKILNIFMGYQLMSELIFNVKYIENYNKKQNNNLIKSSIYYRNIIRTRSRDVDINYSNYIKSNKFVEMLNDNIENLINKFMDKELYAISYIYNLTDYLCVNQKNEFMNININSISDTSGIYYKIEDTYLQSNTNFGISVEFVNYLKSNSLTYFNNYHRISYILFKVKNANGDFLLAKFKINNKENFLKNDSLLQLYFSTDFSYLNTKTYKKLKPNSSSILELHEYKDNNETIQIELTSSDYNIIFNGKKVLKMSMLLFDKILSNIYWKLFLCLNSNYDSRPGSIGGQYNYLTNNFNEILVFEVSFGKYEYYCPQIKKSWYYDSNTNTNPNNYFITYGNWKIYIKKSTPYPYFIKRYIYNTFILIGENNNNYVYIGSYIKANNDIKNEYDYTGIYEIEITWNDIFKETNLQVLGYFLKENLNGYNINEANNIASTLIKNTLGEKNKTNNALCLKLFLNFKTIYNRYFYALLENLFIILDSKIINSIDEYHINVFNIDFNKEPITIGEIEYYRKINKHLFPINKKKMKNVSLNVKSSSFYKLIKENFVESNNDVNSFYAMVYLMNNGGNNSSNYIENYLFNTQTEASEDLDIESIDPDDNLLLLKTDYLDRDWDNMLNIISKFGDTRKNKQIDLEIIKKYPITDSNFKNEYDDYYSIENNKKINIISSGDLEEINKEINNKLEQILNWYNTELIKYNINYKNTFNLSYDIIKNLNSTTNLNFKRFLNNYLNIKKLLLAKEQIITLLSIRNTTSYDCTEIYKIFTTIPLYTSKPQKIFLAYFEYLSGYVVREEQIIFTEKLKNELIGLEKQQIHQMLMGEGKSSTIAPLITLYLLDYMKDMVYKNKIIHIMPTSLVSQSYKTFNNIFFFLNKNLIQKIKSNVDFENSSLLDKDITIISDYLIKVSKILNVQQDDKINMSKYIEYNYNISNSYLIFDEVDEIADPLKSQLNMLDTNIKFEPINNEYITCKFIFTFIYNLYFSSKGELIRNELSKYNFRTNEQHLFLDTDIISNEADTILKKYYNYTISNIFGKEYKEAYKIILSTSKNQIPVIPNINSLNISYLNIIYNFGKLYIQILKQLHRRHFGLKFNSKNDIGVLYNKSNGKIKPNDKIKEYFIAVPFIADEKPSEKSQFTDYLYVIALTIISYLDNYKNRLRKIDLELLLIHIKQLYLENFDLSPEDNQGIIYYEKLTKKLERGSYPIINNKLNINDFTDEQIQILINNFPIKYYVQNIILKNFILVIKEVNNLSFIDIMSSDFSPNRVGFTGTPFIRIPKQVDVSTELNEKIKKQPAADGAVVASIIGSNDSTIFVKNNIDEIIKYVVTNGYHTLIDTGSVFIGSNSYFVAKKIIENVNNYNIKNPSKLHYIHCVVYLNEFDLPCGLNLDYTITLYDSLTINLFNRFYYYDQGHITGIDLKIYPLAKGLVTISSFNRFRDIAQGIFRLRKINRGQTVDFIINTNLKETIERNYNNQVNRINLLNYLVSQETKYSQSQRSLFYKQNIQTIYRNFFEFELNKLKLDIPSNSEGKYFQYLNKSIFRQPVYLNFTDIKYIKYDLLMFSKDEFEYLIKNQIKQEITFNNKSDGTNRLIQEIIANKIDFYSNPLNSSQVDSEAQEEEQGEEQGEEQEEEREQEQEQQKNQSDIYQHNLIKDLNLVCVVKKNNINIKNYFTNKTKIECVDSFYYNQNLYIKNKLDLDIIVVSKPEYNEFRNLIDQRYMSLQENIKKMNEIYFNNNNLLYLTNYYPYDKVDSTQSPNNIDKYLDFKNLFYKNEVFQNNRQQTIYINYKNTEFRNLAPNIYRCDVTNGELYCYMEVYRLIPKTEQYIINHYMLVKKWEINSIINAIINLNKFEKYEEYKIRIIIPGDIIYYSNILDNQIFKYTDDYNNKIIQDNITLIKIILKYKSVTNLEILELYDKLYYYSKNYEGIYKDDPNDYLYSTSNVIFGNNNFEKFFVNEFIGQLTIETFLNLMFILRFIIENINKYSEPINFKFINNNDNNNLYETELISNSKIIIEKTIGLMENCNNRELDFYIEYIKNELMSNNNFIKNFTSILIKFDYGKSSVFNLNILVKYKNNIKRFWFLLNKIYDNNLPDIKQNLCNYVDEEELIKYTDNNKEITLTELDKYKNKYYKK